MTGLILLGIAGVCGLIYLAVSDAWRPPYSVEKLRTYLGNVPWFLVAVFVMGGGVVAYAILLNQLGVCPFADDC